MRLRAFVGFLSLDLLLLVNADSDFWGFHWMAKRLNRDLSVLLRERVFMDVPASLSAFIYFTASLHVRASLQLFATASTNSSLSVHTSSCISLIFLDSSK